MVARGHGSRELIAPDHDNIPPRSSARLQANTPFAYAFPENPHLLRASVSRSRAGSVSPGPPARPRPHSRTTSRFANKNLLQHEQEQFRGRRTRTTRRPIRPHFTWFQIAQRNFGVSRLLALSLALLGWLFTDALQPVADRRTSPVADWIARAIGKPDGPGWTPEGEAIEPVLTRLQYTTLAGLFLMCVVMVQGMAADLATFLLCFGFFWVGVLPEQTMWQKGGLS